MPAMNQRAFPRPRSPLLVRLLRLAILTLLSLCCFGALLLGGALMAQYAIEDRIAPGASVAGLDLAMLTRDEAQTALEHEYGHITLRQFTFRDGERRWTATAEELGLSLPAAELVERAYAIGHAGDLRTSLRQQAAAWMHGHSLPLRLRYDEAKARAWLEGLAAEIRRERRDASLVISTRSVGVDPGWSGRELDIESSLANLSAALLDEASTTEIALVVRESPARQWNIDEVAAQLRIALSTPLHLVGTDRDGAILAPWILSQDQILAALNLRLLATDAGRVYEASLDMRAIARYLGTLSPALSQAPVDAKLDFDPGSGGWSALSPATRGRRLDVEATVAKLEEAVFDPVNRRVGMVFQPLEPRYHEGIDPAALGVAEQVAEATTYFWGSWQNRRSNIALGAGKLNGIIIAPGEEFSFNEHLGEITPAAGYLEGSVILGGATVTGIGGGICQVSTTMFRAAYSGGYAITERNSHGYRVGYYEYAGAGPGLDAAIWQPEVDLRFQNNTPHHLLIESSFLPAQDAIQFRIYSTRHWRTVVESPLISALLPAPEAKFVEAEDLAPGQIRQIDYSADGADVQVWRNIYDAAGELVSRDQVFTRYAPWQAVFEVAPGDSRLPAEEDEAEQEPEEEEA